MTSSVKWKIIVRCVIGFPVVFIAVGMIYDLIQDAVDTQRKMRDPLPELPQQAQRNVLRPDPQQNIKEQLKRLDTSTQTPAGSTAEVQ